MPSHVDLGERAHWSQDDRDRIGVFLDHFHHLHWVSVLRNCVSPRGWINYELPPLPTLQEMRGCWCLGRAGYLTRQISGLRKVFPNLSTIHKTCLSTLPSDTRLSLKFCPQQGSLWQISKVAFWRRTYSALSYTQGRQPLTTLPSFVFVLFILHLESAPFCSWVLPRLHLVCSR